MKSFQTFVLSCFLFILQFLNTTFSQTPVFTWMKGPNTTDQSGVYGTQTVYATTNQPGARENAMSWTDATGKFWLFGGHGYNNSTNQGLLNDLWVFDPSTLQWAWMSGTQGLGQGGVYGTQGTSSASNKPGARQNGVTWVDNNGNLWLFGGQTVGTNAHLNDLWKYNVSTNQWTWISGSNTTGQASNFGTINTPNSSNVPGARFGALGWVSNTNQLYLFGGQEYTTAQQRSNDLWKYDITTGLWTWIGGSNLGDQNGVYGTLGIEAAGNMPGARQASLTWKDNSGNFWLFGGNGFAETGSHNYLNDLWKYNVTSNQWTWISGSKVTDQVGNYGTMNTSSATNIPGARQLSISWIDNNNKLWLFGGWGHLAIGQFGHLNDLWSFNTSTNNWTWEGGTNSVNNSGNYGSIGVGTSTTLAGARRMSVSWKNTDGSLWFFGGHGSDSGGTTDLLFSDVWKIQLPATNGMNSLNTELIKVYPNPSQGKFTIYSNSKNDTQSIMTDQLGRCVETINLSYGENQINISELENGSYYLKIENGQVFELTIFK